MNKKIGCIFVLCCFVWVLLSCNGNKQKNNDNVPLATQEVEKPAYIEPVTAEQIRDFIYENDDYSKRWKREIIFIDKANFGIPHGDNWIVRRSDRSIIIYAISNGRIVKDYSFTSFDLEEESSFDIMQDIPGKHIGNSTSSIFDFNGDGIDEIFEYGFYGRASLIKLWGYDEETDDFTDYCTDYYRIPEIPFDLIDRKHGPAPVVFMTYKGMDGFKVYSYTVEWGIGPDASDIIIKHEKWVFYAWDEEQRQYIELGEIEE